MKAQGFFEFQTPILTASSPEARAIFWFRPGCILANSMPAAGAAAVQAAHHGGGFRPLFPDRALFPRRGCARDRSPGEFYQLDIEMSFVTQEDVFASVEPVLRGSSRSSAAAAR